MTLRYILQMFITFQVFNPCLTEMSAVAIPQI